MSDSDTFNVNVLIGADYYWDFIEDRVIRGNGPTAVKSKLGYVLSGPLKHTSQTNTVVTRMFNVIIDVEEQDIELFWRLESIGIDSTLTETKDDYFTKKYQESSIEFGGNKYVARLP